MEKNVRISLLFDFYGQLLSPQQRQAVDLYYNDDLSLSEISSELGITRQGVRDAVKRAEALLVGYEEKLGLLERFGRVESALGRIEELSLELAENYDRKKAEEIHSIASSLHE